MFHLKTLKTSSSQSWAQKFMYLNIVLLDCSLWELLEQVNTSCTTFALVRHTCDKKCGLRPDVVHWLYTRVIRPFILHGALVWWPKVMQKTTKNQLGRIQRMACLTITGAMKSTPTAAIEILLNLTARSPDHGGGEDDTLQTAYTHATSRLHNSSWDAIHLEKHERPHTGHVVRSHYSSLSLLQNLQGHY